MQGFSPRNLKYMRAFAAAWPDEAIVQQAVARLPWRQNIILFERLEDPTIRHWYVQQALAHGWSSSVLNVQIDNRVHERSGKAISNFTKTLPPADSDMVEQVFKDPYLFDFLGTADPRREREVEQALIDHIQRFMLELGTGFASVGRQVHLEIGEQDFYLDLLFYHLQLRCFVVVELKTVPFDAAFVGKLNLYLSATDDLLRHPDEWMAAPSPRSAADRSPGRAIYLDVTQPAPPRSAALRVAVFAGPDGQPVKFTAASYSLNKRRTT